MAAVSCVFDRLDVDVRVEIVQPLRRRREFGGPHRRRPVQDLSLEIGDVDHVEVDESERAHAGSGEIERRRRAQAAGADQQDARRLEAALAVEADLRKEEVPRVAEDLILGQCGSGGEAGRHGTAGSQPAAETPAIW